MVRKEFERIARLEKYMAETRQETSNVTVGTGDDASVFKPYGEVVACVDTLVEGRHFLRTISSSRDIGYKSIAVNVSDIAAMGSTPRVALVSLQTSTDWSEDDIDELYAGMVEACEEYSLEIVGGDSVSSPTFAVSVTVIGEAVAPVVIRAGARTDDAVGLVGFLGSAGTAVHCFENDKDIPPTCLKSHQRPKALAGVGQLLANLGVHSMIDVSDGLGADATHIASLSGVSIGVLYEAIKDHVHPEVFEVFAGDNKQLLDTVIGGGEDFALLFTCDSERIDTILQTIQTHYPELPSSQIGVCSTPREDSVILYGSPEETDSELVISDMGFDHG